MSDDIIIGFIVGSISAIILLIFSFILNVDLFNKKNFFTSILLCYLVSKFLLFIISDYFLTSKSPQSTTKNLELIEAYKCRLDYGAKGVCGTIKNNSSHTYSYAQVGINLYDANGTLVGSTMANINNFKPNKYWHFKTFVIENDAVSFEVEEISGF